MYSYYTCIVRLPYLLMSRYKLNVYYINVQHRRPHINLTNLPSTFMTLFALSDNDRWSSKWRKPKQTLTIMTMKQTRRTISILKRYEPGHKKMCLKSYANNKGADQPAHPRSLINAFVVRCLDSMIHILAKSKISRL